MFWPLGTLMKGVRQPEPERATDLMVRPRGADREAIWRERQWNGLD